MYDVLNRSPEYSLVTSLAAAFLFSRCQPRALAFPFPENGACEAEPVTLTLVRGADPDWVRACLVIYHGPHLLPFTFYPCQSHCPT